MVFFLFLFLFLPQGNNIKAQTQQTKGTMFEAQSVQGKKFLANLNKVYASYQKVTASFVIKGKVGDAEVYFLGTLFATDGKDGKARYLSIVLKDTVFESKVYQLIVDDDTVTNIDYLNDKKETLPMSRFTWAQILGSVFPFRFFYPLLSGFPPEEIYSGVIYQSQNKIINDKGKYDVAVTLDNFVMQNIYVKNLSAAEVIVFRLSGEINKKGGRYFPKYIYMERSKKKDHLEIIFNYLSVH